MPRRGVGVATPRMVTITVSFNLAAFLQCNPVSRRGLDFGFAISLATHVHIRIHIHIHNYIHIYTCIYTLMCIYIYKSEYMHMHLYAYVRIITGMILCTFP